MISSLSFIILGFENAAIGLDMSWFLTIVANSIIPGLAPASLIAQRSGRTSSNVPSVGQTLYYVGVIGRIVANDFLRASSITSEYFTAAVDALHTIVTKVSHEGGETTH